MSGFVNDGTPTRLPDAFDDPWSLDSVEPTMKTSGAAGAARAASVATPVEKHTVGMERARPFTADMDLAELDDRFRPGPAWTAKAQSVSPSSLSLLSRRMTFVGRTIIAAVHLIDCNPVVMVGKVVACEYVGSGLHQLDLELMPVPSVHPVREWISARRR